MLLIDEINERPYRIDRMLTQIVQSGLLGKASAVVCSEFRDCCSDDDYHARDVIAKMLGSFPGPVVFGFPTGHTRGPMSTAPLGITTAVMTRPRSAHRHRGGGSVVKVHLIGICGTAMASLALLLRQRGVEVAGSDENAYPPMSSLLAREGIAVLEGYQAEHVTDDLDVVVVGNVVSRGNPEVEAVLSRRVRHVSLPEMIRNEFLWPRRPVVVAGTHGQDHDRVHGGLDPCRRR